MNGLEEGGGGQREREREGIYPSVMGERGGGKRGGEGEGQRGAIHPLGFTP